MHFMPQTCKTHKRKQSSATKKQEHNDFSRTDMGINVLHNQCLLVSLRSHINVPCQAVNTGLGHSYLGVYLWDSKSCHLHCENCQCLSADCTDNRGNIPCETCSSVHSPPPDGIVIITHISIRSRSRSSNRHKIGRN